MLTQAEIVQLQREAQVAFKQYPGVVAVDFGFKEVGGESTDQLAWLVNVVEKKPASELKSEDIIPAHFKGFPTDVIQVPKLKPLHCEDMAIHSRLVGGITVTNFIFGPTNSPATGTLGFFATIDGMSEPENVALVSNNHVLAAFGGKAGDTVYQPKHVLVDEHVMLSGDPRDRHPVGKIQNTGKANNLPYQYPEDPPPTGDPPEYYVDCASAKINISISSWCHTNCGVRFKNEILGLDIRGNSTIADVARVKQADLQHGDYVVYKVGRTTSKTTGKVLSTTALGQPGKLNLIKIEIVGVNCNEDSIFADSGDSGSALVNDKNQLVGLVFAQHETNPKQAFACHIHPVMACLGVTPITTANPHSAESTEANLPGTVAIDDIDQTSLLREKFLRTEKGREIYSLIMKHRFEVVDLVNHKRPVTVAWHRAKGPMFISHMVNNARDPAHRIPQEIEGVRLMDVMVKMAQVLSIHGSTDLKAVIDAYRDEVLGQIEQLDSLHTWVECLDAVSA